MHMPEDNRDRENGVLEAPPELVSALKRLPKTGLFIPPTVDEAILHAARRQLSQQPARGIKWSFALRWGIATAALVLLLAGLPLALRRTDTTSSFARGDLNHDGQVDILDAFALARELKTGIRPSLQMDVNGDGVVDERDVATLAARAVSLGKGGRS